MKELILVRHAKSSWDYDAEDADRPLQERGISDAHRVAEAVSGRLPEVQAVFSSPANRALHTCMIVMRELEIPLEHLQVRRELYDFSGTSVRDFILGLDEGLHRVMVFGHNHAMTYIANTWGNKYIENVPTSGLVHLALQEEAWKDVSRGQTRMLVFPKHLK